MTLSTLQAVIWPNIQDEERTLTDAEVEKTMDKILSGFQNEFGAILR